jgi:hypothetical protein
LAIEYKKPSEVQEARPPSPPPPPEPVKVEAPVAEAPVAEAPVAEAPDLLVIPIFFSSLSFAYYHLENFVVEVNPFCTFFFLKDFAL